jgi:hypothetical protein
MSAQKAKIYNSQPVSKKDFKGLLFVLGYDMIRITSGFDFLEFFY